MSHVKTKNSIAILHYSAAPVIGGVEAVIDAHVHQLLRAGYAPTVIAGRGDASAFPAQANFLLIPEIDSKYTPILELNKQLEIGVLPDRFETWVSKLESRLRPVLEPFDHLIVHNVFTKHFNLPLTSALHRLIDSGALKNTIAWCHDFTWTSPSSGSKVHPGYPWDLLRTPRPDIVYVVVSKQRQHTLAGLFQTSIEKIKVIYNGVDAAHLLGLSSGGVYLAEKLGLFTSDLNILMPVRVTQAKNIEFALNMLALIKDAGLIPLLIVTGPPDPHDSGSMQYFQSLKDLRAKLDLDDQMHFIFESGPDPDQPYLISEQVVGDLYRLSDVMFMPSHREGFGMPVLEAGLAGIQIVASSAVPAAVELSEHETTFFQPGEAPYHVAEKILGAVKNSPISRLRRTTRMHYTWQAIFESQIKPLLPTGDVS